MVKTPRFHYYRGTGSISDWGTKTLHATQCGPKIEIGLHWGTGERTARALSFWGKSYTYNRKVGKTRPLSSTGN